MKKGTNPKANPFNLNGKYNNYDGEIKAVKIYLSKYTATATMVANALDIYRPNLCRYKSELEKAGLLVVIYKGDCKITNYPAQYLTTDPKLVQQLKKGGLRCR